MSDNTTHSFKKIIHIDMDAFFVSVEIRDNPALANRPVAVGGNEKRRGVIATCNYLARQYGVRSAMASHKALQLCPDLLIIPGRMSVYKEVSAAIRQIMQRYTDIIEPLSLDEAYLDVTDCTLCKGSATLIAQDIRNAIFNELGLTASAGIAPIKFLAKIASDLNKPNGQYVITPGNMQQFIAELPLEKISGVGKVTAQKLQQLGFFSGADVRAASENTLQRYFGKFGLVLWRRCHGIDDRAIEVTRVRKSVGVENTFAQDINNIEELTHLLTNKILPELQQRASKYLTQQCIHKLGVKVKFNDFQQTTKELTLTDFSEQVFLSLLKDAHSRGEGKAVRLLGAHIGLVERNSSPVESIKQYEFSF